MRRLLLTTCCSLAAAPSASAAIRITETPAEVTNVSAATFAFASDASPAPTGYACALDGSELACSSPQAYAGLAPGDHVFTVRSTGTLSPEAAAFSWRIDTRAPRTTITRRPADFERDGLARFAFATDEEPGVIECRLDGSSWLPCPRSLELKELKGGAHTLQARAVDEAGNRDATPATASWTVDAAVPVVRVAVVARARGGSGEQRERAARLVNPAGGRLLVLARAGLLVRGEAVDASRVTRIAIALQRVGTCRFFDGRRALRARRCSEPRWLPARLAGTAWAYRLARGARIPRGTYQLRVRAEDAAGNAASDFTLRRLSAPRTTLRVLTFNVTGGPSTGPAFNPGALAAIVGRQNADVIALQEICSWATEQLVATMGATGYRYYAHLPAVLGVPDSRAGSGGGCDYGNAIVSRLPLSSPSTRARSWFVAPPACKYYSSQSVFPECRLAASADVVPLGSDRRVRISAIQLGPDRDPLQNREAAALGRLAAAGPARAIVLGDLNMKPGDERLDGLRRAGFRSAGGVATFPFTSFESPYVQIDAIFARGRFRYSTRAVDPVACEAGVCEPISDHRALVSTITLL